MEKRERFFRFQPPFPVEPEAAPAQDEFPASATIQDSIDNLRDFIKSILHGLTTPYAALTGYVNLVLNEVSRIPGCMDGEETKTLLEGIRNSQEGYESFIGKLRLFAEPLNLSLNSASMTEFIESIVDDPDITVGKKRKINFTSKVKQGQDYAEIDYSYLNLALKSIFKAVASAPGGKGAIRVRLDHSLSPEMPNLWETIASHGAPMEKGFFKITVQDNSGAWLGHDLSEIFLPFFTEQAKPHDIDRLDLPIAYQIVRAHDGFFRISQTEKDAFLLMVYLPE